MRYRLLQKKLTVTADQGEVYRSNPGQTACCELPCKEVAEQCCHAETVSRLHEARYCVIQVLDL